MKLCPKCKRLKDVSCFGKSSQRKDGLQAYCKQCKNEYAVRSRPSRECIWCKRKLPLSEFRKIDIGLYERHCNNCLPYKNIVGLKFNDLTITEIKSKQNGRTFVLCKCVCGGSKLTTLTDLRTGNVKSCGCLPKRRPSNWRPSSTILQKRFNLLIPVKEVDPHFTSSGKKKRRFLCRCTCGNMKITTLSSLVTGKVKSCGCLGNGKITHNLSKTPEYQSWRGAKRRCFNENSKYFSYYGGRGITMCKGWRTSFEKFINDMGMKPSPQHTLDRIDRNGHYSCGTCEECVKNNWPMNCRWATRKQQLRNTRRNFFITAFGQTKTLSEWAEEFGIRAGTIRYRIVELGWPAKKAVSTPAMR